MSQVPEFRPSSRCREKLANLVQRTNQVRTDLLADADEGALAGRSDRTDADGIVGSKDRGNQEAAMRGDLSLRNDAALAHQPDALVG